MKYNIRPEFRKYSLINAPTNPIILKIVNFMMPIVQKENSPYEKELETEAVVFGGFRAQLIRPKGKKNIPCLVYFHGGAFVLKASRRHKNIVREYAYKTGIAVLFVDYRLAPKFPFPIPLNDCYQAYRWAAEKFADQKVYVGGDSAGGNLALGVTRMALDKKERVPDKLLLIYPVTDSRMQTASMKEFVDTPLWNARLNAKMWSLYTTRENRHHVYASPAEAEDFSGFPECYVETAEFDCLRDEGIALAGKLKTAGVSVTLLNTKQTMHGFDVAEQSKYVRECVKRRIEFLGKAEK